MFLLPPIAFLYFSLNFTVPIHEGCIDTRSSHVVSVNCDGIDCFSLSSGCGFDKYSITVYNRNSLKVATFSSPLLDDINRNMNNLKYDSSLVSGTYFAFLKASHGQNYLEKKFIFVLFK